MDDLDLRVVFETRRAAYVLEEARWYRALQTLKTEDPDRETIREATANQEALLVLAAEPLPETCTPEEIRELELLRVQLVEVGTQVLNLLDQRRSRDIDEELRRITEEGT